VLEQASSILQRAAQQPPFTTQQRSSTHIQHSSTAPPNYNTAAQHPPITTLQRSTPIATLQKLCAVKQHHTVQRSEIRHHTAEKDVHTTQNSSKALHQHYAAKQL
jgi:hypothetical protein